MLANPATTIQENTYYALAGGGGVLFKGREYQLYGSAPFNPALIEVIVIRYRLHGWVLAIPPRPTPLEQHLLWAAIADFHGVPHNLDRRRHYVRYEEMAQRVYANLQGKYPNYTPPTRFRRFPALWVKDAFRFQFFALVSIIFLGFVLGLNSALSLFALWLLFWPLMLAAWWLDCNIISPPDGKREWVWLLGFLAVVLAWPVTVTLQGALIIWQAHDSGGNPAYERFARKPQEFKKLLRDLKAKHPQQFAGIAQQAKIGSGLYPDPFLNNINTREAFLILRAIRSINGGDYNAYQTRTKNPYIRPAAADVLVRQVAAEP